METVGIIVLDIVLAVVTFGLMIGGYYLFLVVTGREKGRLPKFKMAYLGILAGLVFIAIGAYQVWKPNRITVDAKMMWTPTGITVKTGQLVDLEVSGQVTASTNPNDAANKLVGPEGWGYDPQKDWTYNGSPTDWTYVLGKGSSLMCLTAKIGDGPPMLIGNKTKFQISADGPLYLGVNDALYDHQTKLMDSSPQWQDNGGAFLVTVKVE